ncbi:MAG: hypothetical protein ACI9IP_003520 [Arcticibacterium sp.]|jgi:hypothetical protein
MRAILIVILYLSGANAAFASPLSLKASTSKNPPPRIIRTCCSFGSDVRVTGIPFLKVSDISSISSLGKHVYLGNTEENNGIIYTEKGGFIDIGHLRDQADWTAYLHQQIQTAHGEKFDIKLGREGGQKTLQINANNLTSFKDKILLAGKIAYDLSVWHEIATFYGASYVPMVPEKYSAFSMEDAYSNLLGVEIGIAALESPLPFEEAVTFLLKEKLHELGAVNTMDDTFNAMEIVRDVWWTRAAKLPSKNILLQREFDIEGCLEPWLVNDLEHVRETDHVICPPKNTIDGASLQDYYVLSIQLNMKFPVRKLLSKEVKRVITQKDFNLLIQEAKRKTENQKNHLGL